MAESEWDTERQRERQWLCGASETIAPNKRVIRVNSDIIVENDFQNQPIHIWAYSKYREKKTFK